MRAKHEEAVPAQMDASVIEVSVDDRRCDCGSAGKGIPDEVSGEGGVRARGK
jgi:hypothetical protein